MASFKAYKKIKHIFNGSQLLNVKVNHAATKLTLNPTKITIINIVQLTYPDGRGSGKREELPQKSDEDCTPIEAQFIHYLIPLTVPSY